MSGAPRYLTNAELEVLSQQEAWAYLDQLADAHLDDGPEWDRIYDWADDKGLI